MSTILIINNINIQKILSSKHRTLWNNIAKNQNYDFYKYNYLKYFKHNMHTVTYITLIINRSSFNQYSVILLITLKS